MAYDKRFKEFHFTGALSKVMEKYVSEKRAIGRLFNKQCQMLARLDKMSINLGITEEELSRELVERWITKAPNESRKNQRYRLNFVKLLGEFMLRLGYVVYIPTVKISSRNDDVFVPYIFTENEIALILGAVDNLPKTYGYPKGNLVYPVLFRVLYCCGLRVSEAVKLTIEDVDLDRGILKIWLAKHNKHRQVPMSPELTVCCKVLAEQIHMSSSKDDFFFPNARNKSHNPSSVYHMFRKLLQEVKISHGGKGNGPRLHDLRHTFAVHCLQKWDRANVDLKVALPYLSSYLGHKKLSGTQKYLRLTTEAHKDVVAKLEVYSKGVIPRLENIAEGALV